ncbi:MAG: porin [Alphaproteobacteria bacterium]|nr:porin [Alphaproteobacteria bacterium]
MKKLLLATTALVGFAFAGGAQANVGAASPLKVTLGGDIEVVGATFREKIKADGYFKYSDYDFATFYSLNVGVTGKGAGFTYGGELVLDNEAEAAFEFGPRHVSYENEGNGIKVSKAIVFLEGNFGRVQAGDAQGATDLAVKAPSVGMGQTIDGGRYVDFLGASDNDLGFPKLFVYGIDGRNNATNITYYTPKFGNEQHKVQAGITYAPKFWSYGADIAHKDNTYRNVIKGAVAYDGNIDFVALNASAHVITGSAGDNVRYGFHDNLRKSFLAWGLGANASAYGVTIGATYEDLGHFGTPQDHRGGQHKITAGIKYEQDKFGVAFNYTTGKAFNFRENVFSERARLKGFNAYGLGGTYKWAPGLTTNADLVFYDGKSGSSTDTSYTGSKGDGYVFMLSQKLAF